MWDLQNIKNNSLLNVRLERSVCVFARAHVLVCVRAHFLGSKLCIVVTCHVFIEIFYNAVLNVTVIEHQMYCSSLNMKIVFKHVGGRSSKLLEVDM